MGSRKGLIGHLGNDGFWKGVGLRKVVSLGVEFDTKWAFGFRFTDWGFRDFGFSG